GSDRDGTPGDRAGEPAVRADPAEHPRKELQMRPIWILAASALLAGTLTGCTASNGPTGGPSPSGAALGAGPAASGSPSPPAVPSGSTSTEIAPCPTVTQT